MAIAFFVNTMALKLLEVLWKGLKTLSDHIKIKKKALQAQVAECQSILSQDEQWLDHDINLVDKQQVLEIEGCLRL